MPTATPPIQSAPLAHTQILTCAIRNAHPPKALVGKPIHHWSDHTYEHFTTNPWSRLWVLLRAHQHTGSENDATHSVNGGAPQRAGYAPTILCHPSILTCDGGERKGSSERRQEAPSVVQNHLNSRKKEKYRGGLVALRVRRGPEQPSQGVGSPSDGLGER